MPAAQIMHADEDLAPIETEYEPARQETQDVAAAEDAYVAAPQNAHPASRAARSEVIHDREQYSFHPEEGTSSAVLVMKA